MELEQAKKRAEELRPLLNITHKNILMMSRLLVIMNMICS